MLKLIFFRPKESIEFFVTIKRIFTVAVRPFNTCLTIDSSSKYVISDQLVSKF